MIVLNWITSVSFSKKGKGNSMRTTIPLDVVKLLDLKEHDKLKWIYDREKDVVIIKRT